MLHMLVNTHSAESCAFRNDENREALLPALSGLTDAASAQGASVQGVWVNRAAHTVFALVDATDAHAVDEVIRVAGLIGWTDSRVFAVSPLGEAAASVTESS